MKSKFLAGIACLLVLVCTVGCTNKKENTTTKNTTTKTEEKEKTVKSKCSYYKCLSKMSLDNTMEELNNIVGFEATNPEDTTSTTSEKYEYDFGDDKVITVTLYNDKISSIKLEYDRKELKNNKVTLDNLSDIKARINDGISYDEFKKAVGGVDGTLIELSSWNKYVWVAGDGSSYITGSFGKDGNLKFFSGLGFK